MSNAELTGHRGGGEAPKKFLPNPRTVTKRVRGPHDIQNIEATTAIQVTEVTKSKKETVMAKFYVESGTLQMITDAEDSRGAALWALHRCMEQVFPVCGSDPLGPEDKRSRLDQRGCDVLDATIAVSQRGFGRPDAEQFDTPELFVEWNQLVTAVARLERALQTPPRRSAAPHRG